MSTKQINLLEIFHKLEHENYCIIKLPNNFPDYDIGSDLDIFCYDVDNIAKLILSNVQKYITSNKEVKITKNHNQIYIDIVENKIIHFRFDLYGKLPYYNNINIKKAFFSSVIENTKNIDIKNITIKVPSDMDEAILRYIEYQEWYAQRPDKIKHIKYLEERIKSNDIDIGKMLDKLHYYTSLPNIEENKHVSSNESMKYMQYLFENLKKIVKYLKVNGLKDTIIKVKEKLIK
jgi:hypothetical protein